jgi:hypothetical protein
MVIFKIVVVLNILTELDKVYKVIKDCEEGRNEINDLLEGPICHSGFKRLN